VLEKRAAGAVDDALRGAGGAGRVQDVDRVGEREPLEREVGRRRGDDVGEPVCAVWHVVRRDDQRPHARQPRQDRPHLGEHVGPLTGVGRGRGGHEDGRLDLAEPVADRVLAEVR
jgi:hypothetical protein